MGRESLLPRQLRYFAALYGARDYGRAARSIPISYQGLRKSIKYLEDSLEATLFLADGDALVPTPYADRLFDLVTSWETGERGLRRAFDQMRLDERGLMSVCAASGLETFFGDALSMPIEHGGKRFSVAIDAFPDDEVEELVASGMYDLGLVYVPYPEEGFRSRPLARLGACAFVPREHPLARQSALSLSDLDGQQIMLPERRFKATPFIEAEIAQAGACPAGVSYCHNVMDSFLFALNGRGVGFGVRAVGDQFARQSEVKVLPVLCRYSYEYGVVWRSGYELGETDELLVSHLARHAKGEPVA